MLDKIKWAILAEKVQKLILLSKFQPQRRDFSKKKGKEFPLPQYLIAWLG